MSNKLHQSIKPTQLMQLLIIHSPGNTAIIIWATLNDSMMMMMMMMTNSNTDRVLELFVDLFYDWQNLF